MRYQIKATRLQPDGTEVHLADAEDLSVAAPLLASIAVEARGRYYNFFLVDTQDRDAEDLGVEDGVIIACVNA